MATTQRAERLTQAYRRDSAAIKAAVIREVLAVWPLLDFTDIARTWPGLQTAVKAIITARRGDSVNLGENYVRRFRAAEGVHDSFTPVRAPAAEEAAVDVSLRATGVSTILRSLTRGLSVDAASKRALTTVSGAATRIALDGGRQTVVLSVHADQRALGWMRVIHGDTCAFCAMLASRGPVYKTSQSAGDESNRFHDLCDCSVEPVYSRTTTWPEASLKARDLWAASTGGLSGKDAIRAFRAAYEAAH